MYEHTLTIVDEFRGTFLGAAKRSNAQKTEADAVASHSDKVVP